jgi:hypothetical protein
MSIQVSPLDLLLDESNPRFATANVVGQDSIRKYMVVYEDVVKLAGDINQHGGLMPGERIVILDDNGRYVVVEGNRRTCSLQMLLSRDLIPTGFESRIPEASARVVTECAAIEVDVLTDRNAALELMANRHIEGVQRWRPIAKKRFFAANFDAEQTVESLSERTGKGIGEVRQDIRDYKFFLMAYEQHHRLCTDFDKELVDLDIDPFLRIFRAKFDYHGVNVGPLKFLAIGHDDFLNTTSRLSKDLFGQIVESVFRETAVGNIDTRKVLTDVAGIEPLLDRAFQELHKTTSQDEEAELFAVRTSSTNSQPANGGNSVSDSETGSSKAADGGSAICATPGDNGSSPGGNVTTPGGPSPNKFFESLDWHALDGSNPDYEGLKVTLDELQKMSCTKCGQEKRKVYQMFPVAAGMMLRAAYEQSLTLRLNQVQLWNVYKKSLRNPEFTGLKSMSDFIGRAANKRVVLPERDMVDAFNRIVASRYQAFLNANVHKPGKMRLTSASLEDLASGGLFFLIQRIVHLVES